MCVDNEVAGMGEIVVFENLCLDGVMQGPARPAMSRFWSTIFFDNPLQASIGMFKQVSLVVRARDD
jgi:hypothetical protein